MNLEIINTLEDKIGRLIEYCGKLEEEKKALEDRIRGLEDENGRLSSQISMLEEERRDIGDRVERMLQRINSVEKPPAQPELPLES